MTWQTVSEQDSDRKKRRDMLIEISRRRQERSREKIVELRRRLLTCSEIEKKRWVPIEKELSESYRQDLLKLRKLEAEGGEFSSQEDLSGLEILNGTLAFEKTLPETYFVDAATLASALPGPATAESTPAPEAFLTHGEIEKLQALLVQEQLARATADKLVVDNQAALAELRQTLRDKEFALQQREHELANAQDQLSQLEQSFEQAQLEKSSLADDKSELESLQSHCYALQEQILQQAEKISNQLGTLNQLQDAHCDLIATSELERQERASENAAQVALSGEHQATRSALDLLEEAHADLIATSQAQRDAQLDRQSTLQSELTEAQQLAAAAQIRIQVLEAQLSESQRRESQLNERVDVLRQNHEEQQANVVNLAQLQAELNQREERINELEQETQSLREQLSALESEYARSQAQLREQFQEAQRLDLERSELESKLLSREELLADRQSTLKALTESLEASQQAIALLRQAQDRILVQLSEKERQHEQLQDAHADLAARAQASSEQAEVLREQIAQYSTSSAQERGEGQRIQAQLAELESENLIWQQSLEQSRLAALALGQERAHLEEEKAVWQEKLMASQAETRSLHVQLDKVSRQRLAVIAQFNLMRDEAATMKAALTELSHRLEPQETGRGKLDQYLEELERQKDILETRLERTCGCWLEAEERTFHLQNNHSTLVPKVP